MNELGRDQPKQLVFADCKGCPIGDVEIPGVPPNAGDNADAIQLPGVDTDEQQAPAFNDAVEAIELPGMDMDRHQDPPVIEIDDINTTEQPPAPKLELEIPPQVKTLNEVQIPHAAAPEPHPSVAAEAPTPDGP